MIIVMTQSQSKLMLLMEEILHQLIWRIHHYLKGSIYLRWLAGCLSSTVCQSRWTCSPRWNLPGIFGRHCAAVSNDSRGSFEGWHLQGMKKTHPVGWILGREKYKKSVVPLYGLIFLKFISFSDIPNHWNARPSCRQSWNMWENPVALWLLSDLISISFQLLVYGLPFSLQQPVGKRVCAIEFIWNLRMR